MYDPSTGLLWLDAAGINNVVDTVSGELLGGDDVGMFVLSIQGPAADEAFLDGTSTTSDHGGVIPWEGMYFNGKQQLFTPDLERWLDPLNRTDLYRYPTGLRADDFGQVEIGLRHDVRASGGTMSGSVQFVVPEPNSPLLVWLSLVTIGIACRQRR